jgi:catechol 2,3-dioxygenase-like lactoylglutathione lyase family enzyme
MPVETLEHYTIRCRDLEATRVFYENVLGLKAGPRPEFAFPGYWIYCAGAPMVHLVGDGESKAGQPTGALDHIAFRGIDLERTREHLHNMAVDFREAEVPGGRLHQIFLRDPDGIQIELNFRKA